MYTLYTMTTCCARDYKTYLPCNSHSHDGSTECYEHRGFYQKDLWSKRYLRPNKTHNILSRDYALSTSIGRHQLAIEESITSKRITLTEEDIRTIPDHRDLMTVYLILCPFINPSWNLPLLGRAIRIFFGLRQPGVEDISPSFHTYFKILLEHPLFGLEKLIPELVRNQYLFLEARPNARINFTRIWREALHELRPDLCWYSEEGLIDIWGQVVNDTPTKNELKTFTTTILPAMRDNLATLKQWKYSRKMSMAPLKEEIVAKVYHPRHVERWLETGGWDLFDMMC